MAGSWIFCLNCGEAGRTEEGGIKSLATPALWPIARVSLQRAKKGKFEVKLRIVSQATEHDRKGQRTGP
jgi:hypothetical protein